MHKENFVRKTNTGMHVRQIPLTIQYQVKLNFAIPELFLLLQYHKYHMILIFVYLCCKEILKRKATPTYDTYCTVLRMTPCRLRKMTNGNVFYIISAKLEGPRATVWFTYCRLKFFIFHLQIGSNQCCESKYVH